MPPPPPHRSGWPFLRTEAAGLGISERALRSGSFRPVFAGVVVHDDIPDTVVVRARAALLIAPEGAVVSHFTAARLWGGRVPDNEWLHLSFMRDVRFRVRGIRSHCYRRRLDVKKWHGLSITSPGQTFCEMARFLGLVDLVALGDSLVRKKRLSPTELVGFATGWEGQFRSEVIEAARLVRTGVDSSPETALRLLIVLAGFPEPEVNIRIEDTDGRVRFRIELGYEAYRLAIEYDGRWHDTPEERANDGARRGHLSSVEGWTFVIVTGDELFHEPEALLARMAAVARALGMPVPERLSDAWRRHFRVMLTAA